MLEPKKYIALTISDEWVEWAENRIRELEDAAWEVVDHVAPAPAGDYYYSEPAIDAMDKLKSVLIGGRI